MPAILQPSTDAGEAGRSEPGGLLTVVVYATDRVRLVAASHWPTRARRAGDLVAALGAEPLPWRATALAVALAVAGWALPALRLWLTHD